MTAPTTTVPLLIGLTGPIGCGKSSVARMLASHGALVVDADDVARDVTSAGMPALAQIRARFGDGVFDAEGALDRNALAQVVFADQAALADLERIVHPRVREAIDHRLAEAATARVPIVALEAIKLVEGGLAERCDEVWLVECAPATQRRRLADRGASADDIERRLSAQGDRLADRLAELLTGQSAERSGEQLRVRRLSTEGSLDETRGRVEDALADALGPLRA